MPRLGLCGRRPSYVLFIREHAEVAADFVQVVASHGNFSAAADPRTRMRRSWMPAVRTIVTCGLPQRRKVVPLQVTQSDSESVMDSDSEWVPESLQCSAYGSVC